MTDEGLTNGLAALAYKDPRFFLESRGKPFGVKF